jgi:hypothetical protein
MPRAFLASFLALGLLVSASAFAADDTYTLKFHQSRKGDKTEHEKNQTTKNTARINVGGQNKNEEATEQTKEAFTEEILEMKADARRATKLARTYSVAEKTVKGETTKAAYSGETVLIEKTGDKYTFSVKGKALTEREAPELYKQFNEKKDNEPQNEDFLPDQPVKVGGSWTLPMAKSEKMFKTLSGDKMTVDGKKSTIGGKLLKAYKKDGAQFGVLEITFTVFVTEIDLGGQRVKTAGESKLVLAVTTDTCIDGSVPFEDSKLSSALDLQVELPNAGSLTIKVEGTGTEKVRAAKK